jgi:hypothetical protein
MLKVLAWYSLILRRFGYLIPAGCKSWPKEYCEFWVSIIAGHANPFLGFHTTFSKDYVFCNKYSCSEGKIRWRRRDTYNCFYLRITYRLAD